MPGRVARIKNEFEGTSDSGTEVIYRRKDDGGADFSSDQVCFESDSNTSAQSSGQTLRRRDICFEAHPNYEADNKTASETVIAMTFIQIIGSKLAQQN
jgi:hypothetical protein